MGLVPGHDREVTPVQGKRVPMKALAEVIALQLETAGKANLTVTGYSMLPFLKQFRDSVQLEPVTAQLAPGDIALYRRDSGTYILHRVIRLTPEGYLFCGDNQYALEPVRQDQLLARVCSYVRKGKRRDLGGTGYRMYCWWCVKLFGIRKYYIRLRRCFGGLRSRLTKRRNKQ